MSEDKMRDDFERRHESFVREDKQWIMYGFDEGVKACAAIKDAEIADLKTQLSGRTCFVPPEFQKQLDDAQAEIAARDLMIKARDELLEKARTALFYGECSINERNPEVGSKNEGIARMMERAQAEIDEALAKSEHHNSRALEKMLLEATINGFILADDVADTAYESTLEEMQVGLLKLNKE